MFRATIFAVVLGLVGFSVYLATYPGYYKPIQVAERRAGPFILLSKEHIGPYHKIVPVIEEVEKWAKDQGLDCHLSMGLYNDNPTTSEESRLHSRGGCVLPAKPPLDLELPEGFEVMVYPPESPHDASAFVVAEFEGAAGIGPLKVYPKALEFIDEHRLAFEGWNVLEVYEVRGDRDMKTTYYFPLLSGEAMPE